MQLTTQFTYVSSGKIRHGNFTISLLHLKTHLQKNVIGFINLNIASTNPYKIHQNQKIDTQYWKKWQEFSY